MAPQSQAAAVVHTVRQQSNTPVVRGQMLILNLPKVAIYALWSAKKGTTLGENLTTNTTVGNRVFADNLVGLGFLLSLIHI